MKKVFVLAMALCMTLGLSAQKREGNVVTVQGHVHEWLTKQAAGKEAAKKAIRVGEGNVYNINPEDVRCWVGCVNTTDPTMQPVDTAYLLVKWTDAKAHNRGDSILIWGYIWNSKTPTYSYDVDKYSIDMIRAVANFDPQFMTLLQNTGGGNFAVGGFGYNFGEEARVPIEYDYIGAKRESVTDTIHFRYDTAPNCAAPYNQFALPKDSTQVERATEAITEAFYRTGVIKHPFDAVYGYPAYDYDYWKLIYDPFDNFEWQAGWTYGYWSFNIREGLSGDFTYPETDGIATQKLNNNSVHYFVFAPITVYDPFLDGNYSTRGCTSPYCEDCNTTSTK
jgi:hypothetical protein